MRDFCHVSYFLKYSPICWHPAATRCSLSTLAEGFTAFALQSKQNHQSHGSSPHVRLRTLMVFATRSNYDQLTH